MSRLAELPHDALHDINTTDVAVYRAIAASSTPTLDRTLRGLSRTADHSKLWAAVALPLAARPGATRRAAAVGLASIGIASAVTNILGKQLMRRDRPDRVGADVPIARHVPMPTSGSFPSGHSASAFAFAASVGNQLPWLSLPLHVLAAAVAYSRVHTGVHYPGDVVIGAAVGSASAAATTFVAGRVTRRRA